MEPTIKVSQTYISNLLSLRKMEWKDIEEALPSLHRNNKWIEIDNLTRLNQLVDLLKLPKSKILEGNNIFPHDLGDNVVIGRKGQFEHIKVRDEEPLYHYHHVLKTFADPNLMVLRTKLLSTSIRLPTLNNGHKAREIIYVLSGIANFHWQNKGKERRSIMLNKGDSIYVAPWIPHALSPFSDEAEILAIDYL